MTPPLALAGFNIAELRSKTTRDVQPKRQDDKSESRKIRSIYGESECNEIASRSGNFSKCNSLLECSTVIEMRRRWNDKDLHCCLCNKPSQGMTDVETAEKRHDTAAWWDRVCLHLSDYQ